MKKGGVGGGKTITGLDFEKKVDFQQLLLEIDGYEIKQIQGKAGKGVFFNDLLVARCFKKHDFYKYLLEENINWELLISKRLLPDDALVVATIALVVSSQSRRA
jgi:hypothetical protein